MHVLTLEEQIHSLEKEVKRLRSKQPVNLVHAHCEARGKQKKESYAKALNSKPPRTATGNPPSCVGANNSTHNSHGTRGTRVLFKKPSGNGEGQVTSRIICSSSGQSQVWQGSGFRQGSSTQSPNFRIIWGTRFSTREPEVQQVLSALVSSEGPQSIKVKKSVKRSRSRTKWWFTAMAPEDTLVTLKTRGLSWRVT